MSNWPSRERPRERLREKGAGSLGDAELVALILGTGSGGENALQLSQRILSEIGGLEQLAGLGLGALAELPGVGIAKASRFLSALELGVRLTERASGGGAISRFSCSEEIFDCYRARMGALRQEVFVAVGLNNKNEPIREVEIARGSVSECLVGPREVFRPMIAEAAARIVVIHNHPSGDPRPSPHDVALTRRLANAGELLGIPVLDHIVIGHNRFSSLRDLGLIESEPVSLSVNGHGPTRAL